MCRKFGMRIYEPQSSLQSRAALVQFGSTVLGRNRRAEVHVGRQVGNICRAANGLGNLVTVPCRWSLQALCELPAKVYCDAVYPATNRNQEFIGNEDNFTGCFLSSRFFLKPTQVLLSNDLTYSADEITQIQHQSTGSLYLPIGLADNFPNLKSLDAGYNKIQEITYENLRGLTNLETLFLSTNQITSLTSNAFSEVPNLMLLNVGKFLG